MSEGQTDAQIRIEVVEDLKATIARLHEVESATNDTGDAADREFKKAAKAARDFEAVLDGTGRAAKGAKGAVIDYADGFQDLIDRSKAAGEAIREALQATAVHQKLDIGDGLDMTLEQARAIIQVSEARSTTELSTARNIVNAYDREAKAAENAAQRSIASFKAIHDARVAAYTGQFDAATAGDTAAAQSEAARRGLIGNWASIHQGTANARNSAALNTVDPNARIAAQQGYAEQAATEDTKAYTAALKQRIDAQNQAFNAAHAEALAMNKVYDANARAAKGTADFAAGLPRLRYALYDVSNALGVGGLAMLGFSTLAYKTAIDYQANFANVARTTGVVGNAAKKLNGELVGISQRLPATFSDITGAAALAGQLGVANSEIANFTENAIKFSATTNVSVDDTATAFGRLNALLPDVNSNYEGLGSSILKVGVNSVATESAIISISGRIAGIASSVHFTSDEVIGLSGALASIGVQPEMAQGSVTRLFTLIQVAASQGGESLEFFARASGKSAAQFKEQWANDPSNTLVALLKGLNAQGPDGIRVLQALGLSASRDIPTLLKLAQNTDILTESLNNASTGMADGTQLGESYGVKADTVASKLKVLSNNVAAYTAALGDSSTGLGGFLDVANGFLQWATEVAKSPVASTLGGIAVGLVALIGVGSLAASAFLRLAATAAAVATADAGATASGGILTVAWNVLTASATRATGATAAYTVATDASIVSSRAAAATLGVQAVALDGVAVSGKAAGGGMGLLAKSVVGLGIALGLGVIDGLAKMGDAAANNKMQFKDAADALDAYNKQVAVTNLHSGGPFTPGGGKRGDILTNATGANGAMQGFSQTLQPIPVLGSLASFASQTSGLAQAQESIDKIDASMAKLVESGHADIAAEEFKKWAAAGEAAGISLDAVTSKFPLYAASQDAASAATNGGTSDIEAQTQAILDNINAVLEGVNAQAAIQSSLFDLGGTLQASSTDFSVYSETGRANLAALQSVMKAYVDDAGGNSQVLANNLQGLFDALTKGASVPTAALGILSQAIASLGVKSIQPSAINLSSLAAGFDKARVAAAKTAASASRVADRTAAAAKEVRTLVDYANDLSGVFKRAFDIRFGSGQALDSISTGWDKIKQSSEDAADAIRKANDTLRGLSADKSVLTYQLKVARAYGDTERAAQIQAELAKNATETADANKDLTKAQQDNSKTLTGNSKAAIGNRESILGMVSGYEDYITQLASSGMSQDELKRKSGELKQEFIRQATQAGYSKDEIKKYASAFDDMAVSIGAIPRNITVTANTNPALQALEEFKAKAKTKIGSGVNVPVTTTVDDSGLKKAARGAQLTLQMNGYLRSAALSKRNDPAAAARLESAANTIAGQIASGNYWTGGYVGDGGKYDPKGIVHGGEFVFSKEATRNIGVGNLAFAHNMAKSGKSFGLGSGGGGGGIQLVELVASDRQLLTEIRDNIGVTIPGASLQHAVNAGNVKSNRRGSA